MANMPEGAGYCWLHIDGLNRNELVIRNFKKQLVGGCGGDRLHAFKVHQEEMLLVWEPAHRVSDLSPRPQVGQTEPAERDVGTLGALLDELLPEAVGQGTACSGSRSISMVETADVTAPAGAFSRQFAR